MTASDIELLRQELAREREARAEAGARSIGVERARLWLEVTRALRDGRPLSIVMAHVYDAKHQGRVADPPP